MTFYLQEGYGDNREGFRERRIFLDDHVHVDIFGVLRTIEAKNWKAAREQVSDLEALAA